jgi:hypothetical protein
MPAASVLDLIGQTPLVEITRLDTGPCRLFPVGIEEAADLIVDLRSAPE